jgi:hypothetical protein
MNKVREIFEFYRQFWVIRWLWATFWILVLTNWTFADAYHLERQETRNSTPQTIFTKQENRTEISDYEFLQKITVPGNLAWTDLGLDVQEGEEFYFKATGGISLQKGNPIAFCGPEGYDLVTIQQPMKDKNIGALIGKTTQLFLVTTDKETGEEVQNELVEYFFVGKENKVRMPLSGHLFLGINENVVGDNSGEYTVEVYRKKQA